MARVPLTVGRKSDKARAPQASAERLLNCYLEAVPDGKEPTAIYGAPGLTAWCVNLSGAIRGMLADGGVLYAVAGAKLYSINSAGVPTERGVIPGSDNVAMAGDGTNVVVVAGGEIYVFDGTNTNPVTDPDAPAASSVVWMDSFFIFGEANTQQWFISALSDPTSYDALDYASAEWKPDKIVTPVRLRDTLYLAGERTFEAQQNTGAAAFPFQAYADLKIDLGLAGREAISTTNDTMFWLADDFTARRLDGLTATVISTPAIGRVIKRWADKSLTVVTSHVYDNHLFVIFRNPDGCVVFDQTTETWHERESFAQTTWRARMSANCYSLTLFGSAVDGTIWKLDDTVYDEAGTVVVREVITPFAYIQNKRFTISELEGVFEMGVGDTTLDPTVICERSRDGVIWTGAKTRRLGKQGERQGRVLFGAQGQHRSVAFRFRCSDRVRFAMLGAYAEVDAE